MEVEVPASSVDAVTSDLLQRHAESVETRSAGDEKQVVDAKVPLREVLSYARDLKTMTEGHGAYTFHVQSYRHMGHQEQNAMLEELAKVHD